MTSMSARRATDDRPEPPPGPLGEEDPVMPETAPQVPALESYGADLGFTVANPDSLAEVAAAVRSGVPVRIEGVEGHPLPPLPPNVTPDAAGAEYRIVVTDEIADPDPNTLIYHPKSLVVGVGSASGTSAEEIGTLIDETLASAGLAPGSVRCVATVDRRATEPGLLRAATERGWRVVAHPAAELAAVEVPDPSETVRAETGTPSVAEAAALLSAAAEAATLRPAVGDAATLRSAAAESAALRSAAAESAALQPVASDGAPIRSPATEAAALQPATDDGAALRSAAAEAAALRAVAHDGATPRSAAGDGRTAALVVGKRKSARATAAVARLTPRDRRTNLEPPLKNQTLHTPIPTTSGRFVTRRGYHPAPPVITPTANPQGDR
jgi:hypothetical protein